ncbi:enoyl-[acyl-carrier-protein] reductase, mitochondrial [Clupea harengus]|uniref:Enoyl-[acyl-carrier-protein] reductase, mitochondrial n=1 Tax=Clupea harengus TaxID=7950 RepID=A0A6P8GKF1_CLUHA|nr:enoyl-[acyl-carrier-protein] reductase, mitochondrial [Clupea harengus]
MLRSVLRRVLGGGQGWGAGPRRPIQSCSALVYRKHGPDLDQLRMEQWDLPAVGAHSVRLQILAAPVNPADINMMQGTYPILPEFPAVGGNEGMGEVVEVGAGVSSVRVGDWVIPVDAGFGTWRTEAVCDAADLLSVPRDVSLLGASTVSVNPCTAYRMLHDFQHLRPGDTVIQNGANSAVGQAVIQIAAALGLRTINIVRDRPNYEGLAAELKARGADHVMTEDELQRTGLGHILQEVPRPRLGLNCVGGVSGGLVLTSLDSGGTLVTYGGMAKKPLQIPAKSLIFQNISLKGFWMTQWKRNNRKDFHLLQSMVDALCAMLRSGQLTPPTCVLVPFQNYRQAIQATVQPHQCKQVLLMH